MRKTILASLVSSLLLSAAPAFAARAHHVKGTAPIAQSKPVKRSVAEGTGETKPAETTAPKKVHKSKKAAKKTEGEKAPEAAPAK